MSCRKNLYHAALLTILTLGLLSGCSEENRPGLPFDPVSGGVPSELVAVWTFQSVTLDGYPFDIHDALDLEGEGESATITIEADGTYTYMEIDGWGTIYWMEMGNITVGDPTITIRVTDDLEGAISPPEIIRAIWWVTGNTLSLTIVEDGSTLIFTLTK